MAQSIEFKIYGHASVLISYGDTSILTDPWFHDGGNGGRFFAFPKGKIPTELDLEKITALQISHNHIDHFCPTTLSVFPRDIPIIVCKYLDKVFFKQIAALGFTNIVEIAPGFDGISFGPFQLYQIPMPGSPAYDSSLIVRANDEYYYLNNDCILPERMYSYLSAVFGKFKGCFLGFSPFSVYPIAYDFDSCETLKLQNPNATILKNYKQASWDHFALVCKHLKPDWAVPYACGVRLFREDSFIYNNMFNNPYDAAQQDIGNTKALVMWPEDIVDADGNLQKNSLITAQPQVTQDFILPTTTKLLTESFVKENRLFFQKHLLEYVAHESKKWVAPMKIRFALTTSEQPVDFDFIFDGKSAVVSEQKLDDYDLNVSYPSGPLHEVFLGQLGLRRIHYSYSQFFAIQIKKIVYGQQDAQAWGRGWQPAP